MARAGAMYPQVEPRAAALADPRVAPVPPNARVDEALDAVRRAGARALASLGGRVVRETDLSRAHALGLGELPSAALAWTGLPVVDASASELTVRRHLAGGAPLVVVRDARRVIGVVERPRAGEATTAVSLASRLTQGISPEHDAGLWLLRTAGKLGEGMTMPAFAVGGVVRDLLLGRPAPDIDLVVEGDGIAFAIRLHQEIGGALTRHAAFGTASITGGAAPGAVPLPRVDIASARRERYRRPGALPDVTPAALEDDLLRRDFTQNAMALDLAPSTFGTLRDPLGGRHDVRRRLLRPLHPLSFVEDPTRMFRAARYAARLGARLTSDARRAIALALGVGEYPALSGERLRAELALLAAEPDPAAALERALGWGVFALWDRRFRASPGVRARLRALGPLRACADLGRLIEPGDAALLALVVGQRADVVDACLERLGVRGEPRRALAAAARGVDPRLARARRPSEVATVLDGASAASIAGAWLAAPAPVRRRIDDVLRRGRDVRAGLSGDDLIALGVPRGPAVGAYLARLRAERLDGRLASVEDERARVRRWLADDVGGARRRVQAVPVPTPTRAPAPPAQPRLEEARRGDRPLRSSKGGLR